MHEVRMEVRGTEEELDQLQQHELKLDTSGRSSGIFINLPHLPKIKEKHGALIYKFEADNPYQQFLAFAKANPSLTLVISFQDNESPCMGTVVLQGSKITGSIDVDVYSSIHEGLSCRDDLEASEVDAIVQEGYRHYMEACGDAGLEAIRTLVELM